MERKDATAIILDLTEKQMRVALVEMVYELYSSDHLSQADYEEALDVARTHGEKK